MRRFTLPVLALIVVGGLAAVTQVRRSSVRVAPESVPSLHDASLSSEELDPLSDDPARRSVDNDDDLPSVTTSAKISPADTRRDGVSIPVVSVSGHVVDTAGLGQAGIGVTLRDSQSPPIAWSGGEGSFDVSVPVGSYLVAAGPSIATLLAYPVQGEADGRALIVIAPAVDVSGTVVNESRAPVSDARIWLTVDTRNVAPQWVSLDTTSLEMRWTQSDESGAFSMKALPSALGIALQVHHASEGATEVPVPDRSIDDLVVQLAAHAARRFRVQGIVVYADGAPAPSSMVGLGENNRVMTDGAGRFELVVQHDFEEASLVAVHEGFQPAIVQAFGRDLVGAVNESVEVRLVLGPAARSIEGIVEDAGREPLANWIVSIAAGLEISQHQLPPQYAEQLSAVDGGRDTTDAHGRFHLDGLRERSYTIRALDPRTLVVVELESVMAGTADVRIRVPEEALHATMRGRVVARDGTPMPGVQITLKLGLPCGTGLCTTTRESVVTDSLGDFVLANVPRSHCFLMCDGEAICSQAWSVPADDLPERSSISVARKFRFRVSRRSPESRSADAVGVMTPREEHGFLSLPGGYGGGVVPLDAIGEQALAAPEDAVYAVLYKGGVEIKRVSMELRARTTTVVEL